MIYEITATVKMIVDIEDADKIDPEKIPRAYTPEEWHEQLMDDAVQYRLGDFEIESYHANTRPTEG